MDPSGAEILDQCKSENIIRIMKKQLRTKIKELVEDHYSCYDIQKVEIRTDRGHWWLPWKKRTFTFDITIEAKLKKGQYPQGMN